MQFFFIKFKNSLNITSKLSMSHVSVTNPQMDEAGVSRVFLVTVLLKGRKCFRLYKAAQEGLIKRSVLRSNPLSDEPKKIAQIQKVCHIFLFNSKTFLEFSPNFFQTLNFF